MSPGEVFTIYAGVSDDSLAVTFASSSPAVASVDEGGEVTAHSPGSAVVTVMAGGLAQRVAIEVKAPAPELVSSPEEESDKEDEPVYTAKAAEEIPAARKTESPEPGDEPLFYQEEIPPAGFSPDEYSRQVVGLINEERAAAGLTALLIDEGMMEAAAIRAREISKSFSHARPDGTRGGELAGTFGGIGWAAENIAMGPVTPAEAAYTWMTSEQGHRESILEPRASLTGAGCYLSDNNILYWVQLFAE
jgi:uncharacterized protein YkwD